MADFVLIKEGNTYNIPVREYCIKEVATLTQIPDAPPLSRALLVDETNQVIITYVMSFEGNWTEVDTVIDLGNL